MRTFSSLSANGFLSSKKRDQRVSENILVQQFTTLLKIIMLRTSRYLLPGRGGEGWGFLVMYLIYLIPHKALWYSYDPHLLAVNWQLIFHNLPLYYFEDD